MENVDPEGLPDQLDLLVVWGRLEQLDCQEVLVSQDLVGHQERVVNKEKEGQLGQLEGRDQEDLQDPQESQEVLVQQGQQGCQDQLDQEGLLEKLDQLEKVVNLDGQDQMVDPVHQVLVVNLVRGDL